MATCPKCNKELEEDAKFCDACGAQIFETIFCPECGEKNSKESAVCQKCGASILEDIKPATAAEVIAKKKENILELLPKKTMALVGTGIVVIAVLVLLVSALLGSSKDKYGLYLKDGELVYTDYSEKGTVEITSRLLNDEYNGDAELYYASSAIANYITVSDDGKRIFFPDRIDDMEGITLYYREVKKPDKEPVKIDSDIIMYAINNKGTQIAYLKGSDRVLYVSDLSDKEKIASGIVAFKATDDLKKIGYQDEENNYYLWHADKEKVKLASDISSLEYIAEDLSVIYYVKDDALYKRNEGDKDKEKIASDISSVIAIYDSGEVYYTKAEEEVINLMDYVEDDMAMSDATLTEPEFPEYPACPLSPYRWDYDSDEKYKAAQAQYETEVAEYEAACTQLYQDYDKAHTAFLDKRDRDYLREMLCEETITSTKYTLYYFNGTEETVVTDALVNEWELEYAYDKPVMILPVYNQSDIQKIKLSEISNSYDVYDVVNEARDSFAEKYVAVGATLSILEQTDAECFIISSDGSTMYFLDEVSGNGEGDLYKVTISNKKVSKPELYDSDVSDMTIFFTSNDKIAYYKNADYVKGDFFINGKEVDYDVYFRNMSNVNGAVMYYTDWNTEKGYGTLKMFEDGTTTKIADDVHDYIVTNDDDILYLYDFSTKYYIGTLYLYNNGKPKKIDDDVVALIPVYDK